jgi:putative ABC transport system substrate-binding protein
MADIGVFMNLKSTDAEGRRHVLKQELPGSSFDYRHGEGDYKNYRNIARDLVGHNSDARVFVASCWPTMNALSEVWKLGIVFTGLTDSLNPPSYADNVTGIKAFEIADLCPNWPNLLTQIAPNVKRVAVIYDMDVENRPGISDQNTAITNSALDLSLTITPIDAGLDLSSLESAINGFAQRAAAPAGLIVTSSTLTANCRRDIARIAAGNNLPAIYPTSMFTDAGGLMSYGPDMLGLYRRAASDFLKPIIEAGGDTTNIKTRFPPVANREFDLVVSRGAAAALSLTVPQQFTVIDEGGRQQQVTPKLVP